MASAIAGAQAAQARCNRSGQQDGPDHLGHDGARGSISASAGRRLKRAPAPVFKSKHEMAIGRTDERRNPLIPMAKLSRSLVWMSLAVPIWASGGDPASKAGHVTAFEPTPVSRDLLEPFGPSTHGNSGRAHIERCDAANHAPQRVAPVQDDGPADRACALVEALRIAAPFDALAAVRERIETAKRQD